MWARCTLSQNVQNKKSGNCEKQGKHFKFLNDLICIVNIKGEADHEDQTSFSLTATWNTDLISKWMVCSTFFVYQQTNHNNQQEQGILRPNLESENWKNH